MVVAALPEQPCIVPCSTPPSPSALLILPKWLASQFFKTVQQFLTTSNKHYGRTFLEKNFCPVTTEVFREQLLVSGKLPGTLRGAFLRIGPNPFLKPLGGYHWFDGDGMMHAVRIKDGTASYCNHWVRTSRLGQEKAAGWPLFAKLGDYIGISGLLLMLLSRLKVLLGITSTSQGAGTANTAMVAHAHKLMALNEGDMPYVVRILCNGLLETIGRVTFGSKFSKSFTAHPKLDPRTGKLHGFRYTFDAPPYVTYARLGPQGELEQLIPLDLPRPVMMHDFALTQNYSLFMDLPLCFDGERMVKHKNVPFRFVPEHGSRIGLLSHAAEDSGDMLWFSLPAFMVFHTANAWEEEDETVKLFGCYHDTITLDLDDRCSGGIPEEERPRLARITLNPASGAASLQVLTATVGDFPTINPNYQGVRNRYAYVATMITDGTMAVKWNGVAKVDLQGQGLAASPTGGAAAATYTLEGKEQDALVGRIVLPEGCYNGETVFVPRHEDPGACEGEDDGFLISYVHNEITGTSSMWVWDAKTMASEPLAKVELPQRVPYGFHAYYMNETQLQQQLADA